MAPRDTGRVINSSMVPDLRSSAHNRADVTADWLINTTPIGMAPEAAASPMPASALPRFKLVFDAVYKPAQTRLLADAEAAGCAIVSGQRMFDAQAAQQFTLFRSLLR